MVDITSFFFEIPLVALAFFLIWMFPRRRLVPHAVPVRKPRPLEIVASVIIVVLSGIGVWFVYSAVPNSFWQVFSQPGEAEVLLYYTFFAILPVMLALRFFGGGLGSVRLTNANWRLSMALGVSASLIVLTPTIIAAPEFIGMLASTNWPLYMVTIFGEFSEELMFRGFFQTRMEGLVGAKGGIFLAALVFELWHLPVRVLFQGLAPVLALAGSIFTILPSLLLGYIAWRSDSLLGSTMFHVFYNLPLDLLT